MWMGPFHNRSSVIKVEKMCGRIAMCKCTSLVTKQPNLSQNETESKSKRPTFLIALEDFLYKVWIVQCGFSEFVFRDN